MILRILYHVMPSKLHDWMYAMWGKVIVQHKCCSCGREWYRLGDPAIMFTIQVPKGEKDVMGDILNLGVRSDKDIWWHLRLSL